MRIAYFDTFSGAAGDMIVGALLDAGCPSKEFLAVLDGMGIADAQVGFEKLKKQGFAATKFQVTTTAPSGHRHLKHIREIIDNAATLSPRVRERAMAIFSKLAEAEAGVHGSTIEKVHFHEVGAADAIMDIVGAAVALDLMGIDTVECSPIPTGHGTVKCDHGIMPVPAPATAALLRNVPLAACDEQSELTTPTGAAILTTLAARFGPPPAMTIRSIGYGAGTRDGKTRPNVLRVLIGDVANSGDLDTDELISLEANIDDSTAEQLAFACQRLMENGALDVFFTPITMKKSRPAVMVTVLSTFEHADALEAILFAETTTFGVRRHTATRRKLIRRSDTVSTRFGAIRVKVGMRGENVLTAAPEFEDCAAAARQHNVALRVVMDEALRAFGTKPDGGAA